MGTRGNIMNTIRQMLLALAVLGVFSSIFSTPIPAADPFTGMQMMTTGYMMTTAGSMMAAALLAKGFLLGALIPKKAKKAVPVYAHYNYRGGYARHAQYGHGHDAQYGHFVPTQYYGQ